jgi:hypothetical protein
VRPRLLWSAILLIAALAPSAEAQQRRVAGRVTGTSGEPLAAATVSIVGTRIGTMTSDDGRYTIAVPGGAVQLLVRRLGYRPQTVQVGAVQETVDVALERDVLQLAE